MELRKFSFETLEVYGKARALGYMTEEQLDSLRQQFTDIAKMLSGLRNSLEKKLNNQ